MLRGEGVPAVYVNLERVIDRHFAETQLDHQFYSYLKERFHSIVNEVLASDQVPVVTGKRLLTPHHTTHSNFFFHPDFGYCVCQGSLGLSPVAC